MKTRSRPRGLHVFAAFGAIVAIATLVACSSPPNKPPVSPDTKASTPRWETAGSAPYQLNRKVYRVEISRIPLTRTRCWIGRASSASSSREDAGTAKTAPPDVALVEWDPSTATPPIRRVTLRQNDPDIWCSSEPAQFGKESDGPTVTYLFNKPTACASPNGAKKFLLGSIKSIGDKTIAGNDVAPTIDKVCPSKAFDAFVSVEYEPQTHPDLGGVDAQFSRSRSLDPLTPIVSELFKVIAEVALEKAKAGAVQMVKDELDATVCDIRYYRETDGTVAFLTKAQKQQQLQQIKQGKTDLYSNVQQSAPAEPVAQDADAGAADGVPRERIQLFRRVCEALQSVRIEELASSSKGFARALAGDLIDYAFDVFAPQFQTEPGHSLLDALRQIVLGLIEGRSIATEKDFQTMLLRLGNTLIPKPPAKATRADLNEQQDPAARSLMLATIVQPTLKDHKLDQREWSCAVGIGFAVLRECLRRDSCSAEQLQSSLEAELEDPSSACWGDERDEKTKREVTERIRTLWPELGSMLARTIDVFRPPPGVPPNQTAKTATNVLIDALVKLGPYGDGVAVGGLGPFDAEKIRALINSVFDRDSVAGIVAASGLVIDGLQRCENNNDDEQSCSTDVTPQRLRKGIALLNGFVSYASTYKEGPGDAEDGKTTAEREKLRHDERKKAMQALIESTTDRANRGGQWVWSVGVGVGMSGGRVRNLENLTTTDYFFVPSLSLPVGVAVQKLPRPLGFHAQLSVLDLGQYASLNKNGKHVAEPEIGTAATFVGQTGVLLGRPSFSGLVGVEFGYAPALHFDDIDKVGFWRFGIFAGAYIPFFDFN